jgi:hypothetical protein
VDNGKFGHTIKTAFSGTHGIEKRRFAGSGMVIEVEWWMIADEWWTVYRGLTKILDFHHLLVIQQAVNVEHFWTLVEAIWMLGDV